MAIIRRFSRPSKDRDNHNFLNTSADLEKLMRDKGFYQFPVNVEKLVKVLNLHLTYESFVDEVSGVLRKGLDDEWEIVVNRSHPPTRQRFTIAHEIAHYCLHRNEKNTFQDTVFFRGATISPQEHAANRFAGEILMPESVFRQQVEKGCSAIDSLADFFGVSALAVRVRAKQLGMEGHGL